MDEDEDKSRKKCWQITQTMQSEEFYNSPANFGNVKSHE
jgi:hypothetical protein